MVNDSIAKSKSNRKFESFQTHNIMRYSYSDDILGHGYRQTVIPSDDYDKIKMIY